MSQSPKKFEVVEEDLLPLAVSSCCKCWGHQDFYSSKKFDAKRFRVNITKSLAIPGLSVWYVLRGRIRTMLMAKCIKHSLDVLIARRLYYTRRRIEEWSFEGEIYEMKCIWSIRG